MSGIYSSYPFHSAVLTPNPQILWTQEKTLKYKSGDLCPSYKCVFDKGSQVISLNHGFHICSRKLVQVLPESQGGGEHQMWCLCKYFENAFHAVALSKELLRSFCLNHTCIMTFRRNSLLACFDSLLCT